MAHEIMENDNMFSVKTTPWHGLGTILENAPGIDEALEISGLGWEVRTLPILVKQPAVPGKITRTLLPAMTHRAVQRIDTGDIFTMVSARYVPLQNIEAFNVFRPLVESGEIELETAGSLQNGRKVWILAKVSGESELEVKDGDIVKPYVMLSNSHDGSNAVRFGFTPVRVVCNNTLSLAHNSGASKLIRVFHKGDVKGNLETLRETMHMGVADFRASVDIFRTLAQKEINQEDLIKYVKTVLGLETPIDTLSRIEKNILETIETGIGSKLHEGKITLWDAYNGINEWGLYTRGTDQNNRIDKAWFGDGNVLDGKALDYAIKFAA